MQAFELQAYVERFREIADGYPATFLDVLSLLPNLVGPTSEGPWLAGGAVRRLLDGSTKEGDYDFFFRDEQQLRDWQSEIRNLAAASEIQSLRESERDTNVSMTFKFRGRDVTFQLIKFYFTGIQQISEWFDFTMCQCFASRDDQRRLLIHLGDFTAFDIARRRLVVNNVHHAVSTVRRLIKYARQGYIACGGTIGEILTRTVANPTIINEEVISVD